MTFSSSLIKILIVITGVAFNKLLNLVYLVIIKHLTLDNFIQGQKKEDIDPIRFYLSTFRAAWLCYPCLISYSITLVQYFLSIGYFSSFYQTTVRI